MNFVAVLALVVLGLAALVFLVSTASIAFGSVTRKRVERFALRQCLVISPANGNVVIRYLATTRRWRGGLLYLVLLVSFAWVLLITQNQGNVNLLVAFSGWFVGAAIAEWRVDSLARGPRAAAMLHRRSIGDYVRTYILALVATLWLAVLVLGVSAVVATISRSSDRGPAALTLGAGLLAGAAIVLVVRRILARPQPLVALDLLEADNAIRGRSLNVLTGCGLAIGGYLVALSVGEIVPRPDSVVPHLAQLVGFLALPILGVIVARTPRRTPVVLSGAAIAA